MAVADAFGEIVQIVEWLVAQVFGPHSDRYGGFDLQEGDRDPDPAGGVLARYGGLERPGLVATTHIRDLHRDLREVGILLVAADEPEFGRYSRWAVREFQSYARLNAAARQRRPDRTALTAAAGAADPVVVVAITDGLPPGVPYRIRVNAETMEVTAVDRQRLTVLRGREGTVPAPHPSGAAVGLTRWAARLDPVEAWFYERYPGPVGGVVDAATRMVLARWLDERWRCPVVVEAWQMNAGVPTRIWTIPAAPPRPARPADNLWHQDEISAAPRVFVRDLTADPDRPATRPPDDGPTPDRMSVLGYRVAAWPDSYAAADPVGGTWSGPQTLPARGHNWRPEGEMLPEALLGPGRTLGALAVAADRRPLSTFKVFRAVAEVEALGCFDGLNAYDNAFLSLGPCHWTAGPRIYQQPAPGRPDRVLWDIDAGELWAYLAYLQVTEPAAFARLATANGLGATPAWGVDGRLLRDALGQLKFVGRATMQRQDGSFAEPTGRRGRYARVGEYELFRTWHWYHRFQRAARTSPGFRARMWDMARIRIRDVITAPWDRPPPAPATLPDIPGVGGAAPRRVRVGDVFTSERAVALVYRWHIIQPGLVISGGRAANRLRAVLATAQTPAAPTHPGWAGSPAGWTDDHETALAWALLQPPHPAGVAATLAEVDRWPEPASQRWTDSGFTLPVGALPAAERTLRTDRGSLAFDETGLPPPPP